MATAGDMRAVFYTRFGAPGEVLQVGRLPAATIEHPDDVLVRVLAASVNPADVKQMEGSMRLLMDRPFPVKPGFDFSGVVVAVGSGVGTNDADVKVGDEVCGMIRGLRTGTTAEFIAVNKHVVAKKPKALKHEDAAAIPLAALTAMQCFKLGGLKPSADVCKGTSVLITGGAGGVGTFAIQLAKHMFGVERIVTTASAGEKTELVKRLGATDVIDYRSAKVWDVLKPGGAQFDVCLDATGESDRMVELTKPGGAVMSILSHPTMRCLQAWMDAMGPVPGITLRSVPRVALQSLLPAVVVDVATGARSLNRNGVRFDHVITIPNREELAEILALAEAGKLTSVVDSVFELDKGVEAYVRSESGRATGKVVVRVASA